MVIKVRSDAPESLAGYSVGILLIALALAAFGLMVQYSAGISLSSSNRLVAFERQLMYLPAALLAGWLIYRIDLDAVRRHRVWIFSVAMVALVAARIPGIGVSVNGSWRWIDLGFIRLQASDLGKVALVVMLAHYLAGSQRRTLKPDFPLLRFSSRSPYLMTASGWDDLREGYLWPLGVIVFICGGIALGPDLGTILLCCAVGGTMMLMSGARWRYVIPTFLIGAAVFAAVVLNWENRMRRFLSFTDPWGRRGDEAYQLFEGMVAFGVGGLTGQGAAQGLQGRAFLPEAHTDFVFSVIGEEYGLFATASVATAYLVIFLLAHRAMRRSTDLYRFNLCLGATLFLVMQALVNMGVVTGLLPTKGISLPFLSYGGTNLVVMACMVGLTLNCLRDAQAPAFVPGEARA
jgi:cell division protein FtsW